MKTSEVGPGALTDLDRFIFESWGYFVIRDVLSADEVTECLEASERVHAADELDFSQLVRSYESEVSLERLMDHPAVLPKIRGLLGEKFLLNGGWNTRQRPGRPGVGRWHQDGSVAYNFKDLGHPIPLIQLRVAFLLTDQSQPGLGNLEMIPGSHRSRVPLPEPVAQERGDVPIAEVVCAPAGSVLVFHNAVWHRTHEHRGSRDRYTEHYIYVPPWVRSADRLYNSPEFLERTTPMRRALMGEFVDAAVPFGGPMDPLPYDERPDGDTTTL